MLEPQPGCQFSLTLDRDFRCPHSPLRDGRCIFHLGPGRDYPGFVWEDRFRSEFLSLLETAETFDFRGFVFPPSSFNRTFEKFVDLSEARFTGYVDFTESVFPLGAAFVLALFEGEAHFWNTRFKRIANFRNTRFERTCDFSTARFIAERENNNEDLAIFQDGRFNREAYFIRTRFEGTANFVGVRFHGGVSFRNALFRSKALFQHSLLNGEIVFSGEESDGCFQDEANFRKVWAGATVLIFDNVNFRRATFLGTDLTAFTFRDIQWHRFKPPRKKIWLRGRNALWDEFNDSNSSTVAENYRQLVIDCERKRDYETAEDFHVGEMETRRRKGKYRISYLLYRVLSHYGTSYPQALACLGVLMLSFAVFFLFAGFTVPTANGQTLIEYNLFSDSQHSWQGSFRLIDDVTKATVISLSALTLQRYRPYEITGYAGWMILHVATIVLPAQLALILLAMRRRFRR